MRSWASPATTSPAATSSVRPAWTRPPAGRGVGAALTLAVLAAMREDGYAYAIIGGAGPADFYARVAGAIEIPGSTPGVYDLSLLQRTRI